MNMQPLEFTGEDANIKLALAELGEA